MAYLSNRRALLIVNPNARSGGEFGSDIRSILEEGGISITEKRPTKNEGISDLIRKNHTVDLVIVAGGDGSLNAAAKGILETQLPLAILPMGTANDFARTIGIPPDPLRAARELLTYKPHPIDLGEVNGHPYFNVASVGFSADLAQQLSADAKRKFGKLGYAVVAARILWRSDLFTAYLDHNGTTEKISTLQVSVGNGKFYGGGLAIKEDAAIDDGLLDVYSLEVGHWWKLLKFLPSLRQGTQAKWDDIRSFSATELTIKTKKPRPVNTDGELTCWTPAHFKVLTKAIEVFRPDPSYY